MYIELIAKEECMCKQKKYVVMLAIFSVLMMGTIYSEFRIHGIAWSCNLQDAQEISHYVTEIVKKHPIKTATIGSIAAVSLLLTYPYWYPLVSPYIGLHSEQANKAFIFERAVSPKNASKSLEEMQKCTAQWYYPGGMSTTFKDVAGMHEAKAEVYDFVDFLKNPKHFIKMGARIPKGVLLAGLPGTGKTLLARAVAGQASVPLCYVNASEFIEAIVGIGAARVRDLFKQAKQLAPCIIFIDEIDSIGRKRTFSGGGGDNESTQTLNQLLAEMDGFQVHEKPIIVMAATNRIEVLDEALVRPGRFDRHVYVGKPQIKDRVEILRIHVRDIPVSDDCDLLRLARATRGFTGADLACLVNDAAILAVRQKSKKVCMHHFEEAYDNKILGRVCKSSMEITDKELWATAVHEAGHALLHVYQKDASPLYKVSIQPRGHTLGVTYSLPEIERYNDSYEQLFARMVAALGGAVAEELVYQNRGTGAISDLAHVRLVAIDIVAHYGMSDEFKNITFLIHEWQDLSPEIRDRLEIEIHKLIGKAQALASQILTQHRLELDALVALLLEKQVVGGDEVYELCGVDKPNIEFSLSS